LPLFSPQHLRVRHWKHATVAARLLVSVIALLHRRSHQQKNAILITRASSFHDSIALITPTPDAPLNNHLNDRHYALALTALRRPAERPFNAIEIFLD
jgi:hypothetical protein